MGVPNPTGEHGRLSNKTKWGTDRIRWSLGMATGQILFLMASRRSYREWYLTSVVDLLVMCPARRQFLCTVENFLVWIGVSASGVTCMIVSCFWPCNCQGLPEEVPR